MIAINFCISLILQDFDIDGYIDVDNTVVAPSPLRIRNILTLDERVAAIKAYQQRPMYTKVARMFNCSWEQIKNIVSNREAIMDFYEATTNQNNILCDDELGLDITERKAKFLGECVYEYLQRVQYHQKQPITEDMLRVIAMEFHDIMKLQDEFTPNRQWINHFKNTYNVSLSNREIAITRKPPASLDLKDIMTYCTRNPVNSSSLSQSPNIRDLRQKCNSLDAKTAEYEGRRIRKLNFLERALNEYLHRAKFHHKSLKLDDESVQQVAESFNDILKVQDFYPSLTWIREFKQRHNTDEATNSACQSKKRPLLSLDLKDILSYCGRIGKSHSVTLTPKISPRLGVRPASRAGEANVIICLDDKEEDDKDIKPDIDLLRLDKSLQTTDQVPPLKIRKIESINNDPLLQMELQQQREQEELQRERTASSLPDVTKDRIQIKVENEELLRGHSITVPLVARQSPRPCGNGIEVMNVVATATQGVIRRNPTPTFVGYKSEAASASDDSLWQVNNFQDALRFLKPLEEYAMLGENYRAIGLISQLEEVLKQQSNNTKDTL